MSPNHWFRRYKSLPNIAIMVFRQSNAAAGDANIIICSPSAVPSEQPPADLRNTVSHINPASEATNKTVLSDSEILGLYERPVSPPKYRKISFANYAGPEFRRCMALVDEIINSPLANESEMGTSVSPPALETPAKSSDVRSVQPSRDITDRSTVRRFCSMLNIRLYVFRRCWPGDSNTEQDTCDVSREETRHAAGAGDLDLQPRRRKSIWSRTKRFVRRLFCCVAWGAYLILSCLSSYISEINRLNFLFKM